MYSRSAPPSLSTLTLSVILLLLSPALAPAKVRLPNLFGDHMVLQSGKAVSVWGWAEPGEKVRVEFAGQRKAGVADGEGKWVIRLDPIEPSFEGRPLRVIGNDGRREVDDVLVGEVWICGGQSNMEWPLRAARDADLEIDSASFPAIRFVRLPKIARAEPQEDFPVASPTSPEGNWRLCTTETIENCTAVGYYFARRLHRRLGVPVGLVDTSWGGTMAQHWVTKETLRKIPEVKPYFDKFEETYGEWIDGGREEGAKRRYDADVAAWEKKRAARVARPDLRVHGDRG